VELIAQAEPRPTEELRALATWLGLTSD
jgi:hypothetical protein